MREIGRQIDFEPMVIPGSLERDDFRTAIDVALNEVAAQRLSGGERALEINQTVATKLFQVCAFQGFLKQIERQLFFAARTNRQATTIHRHAVPDASISGKLRRCDLEL